MISNVHTETTTENVKSARDSFVEHRKEVHCSRKRWNICLVLDVVGKFFYASILLHSAGIPCFIFLIIFFYQHRILKSFYQWHLLRVRNDSTIIK